MQTGPAEAAGASKVPTGRRPSVFVFIACPELVRASFERLTEQRGGIEGLEPIALPSYPSKESFEAFLVENQADIRCVTVDLDESEQAIGLIEVASRAVPNALVLATDDGHRADAALLALRAGARDVLNPPYDLHPAAGLLGGPPAEEAGGPSGKFACFLPSQGGSGASTSAIHFAASLATELEGGKPRAQGDTSPVLLLDLDFHSDSAAFWLNKRPAYTLVDALTGATNSPSYWRKVTTAWNGIDLLAPPPPDAYVSETQLERLPKLLAAARSTYSWVVADLPPTLFASSRSLLPKADLVFLVCTPEARSLYLARRRLADLQALEIDPATLRLTLNRAGAKRAIEAATAVKSIGVPVSFSIDNDYIEISSAYSDRRLATPSSGPGRQFRTMARVALGLQEASEEKSSGWRRLVGLG